jgi:hypothetical protein
MQITCVCVCFCHGLTAFDLLVLAVRAVLDKVAQAAAINARLIRNSSGVHSLRSPIAATREKKHHHLVSIVVNDAHAHVRNRGCEIIYLNSLLFDQRIKFSN